MSDEFRGLGLETASRGGERGCGDAGRLPSSLPLPRSSFSFEEDSCQHHPVTPDLASIRMWVTKETGRESGGFGGWERKRGRERDRGRENE